MSHTISAGSNDQQEDLPSTSSSISTLSTSITMSSIDQDVGSSNITTNHEREGMRAKWRKHKVYQRLKLKRSGDYEKHERIMKADRERATIKRSSVSEDGKKAIIGYCCVSSREEEN